MEKIVGIWAQDYDKTIVTGELVFYNNKIEFFARNFHHERNIVFQSEKINDLYYLVFVNGISHEFTNKTMEDSISYHVSYVIISKNIIKDNLAISVQSISYSIIEMIDWVRKDTIKIVKDDNDRSILMSEDIESLTLQQSCPHIEINNSSLVYNEFTDSMHITGASIYNTPQITISYDNSVNINTLFNDINIVTQFLALIIGRITSIDDIKIRLDNHEECLLYYNYEFSYNMRAVEVYHQNRISFNEISSELQNFFINWSTFYADNKYDMIRLTYFDLNKNRQYIAVDAFIAYVRILEGYHIRESKDDETFDKIVENAQNKFAQVVNEFINNEQVKILFKEILPDYEMSDKHLDEVSKWIARGYISKKGLENRLRELDKEYYKIIEKNTDIIRTIVKNPPEKFDLYHWIASTRNFYAHYKYDKKDVLDYNQMCNTINILKALVTMVLLDKMNIDKETIRKMMIHDFELAFQTSCLKE